MRKVRFGDLPASTAFWYVGTKYVKVTSTAAQCQHRPIRGHRQDFMWGQLVEVSDSTHQELGLDCIEDHMTMQGRYGD